MKERKGAALLIGVMIITMVILVIGVSMTSVNVAAIKVSIHHSNSLELFATSDGCAEEGLMKLKRNIDYTGETLEYNGSTCIITVTGSGDTRLITVNAASTEYQKIIEIDVTVSPDFEITSWEES